MFSPLKEDCLPNCMCIVDAILGFMLHSSSPTIE